MAILWVCPNELFLEFGDEPKKNKVGIIQVFYVSASFDKHSRTPKATIVSPPPLIISKTNLVFGLDTQNL